MQWNNPLSEALVKEIRKRYIESTDKIRNPILRVATRNGWAEFWKANGGASISDVLETWDICCEHVKDEEPPGEIYSED